MTPDEFKGYETIAYAKGFLMVAATPLNGFVQNGIALLRGTVHDDGGAWAMQINQEERT